MPSVTPFQPPTLSQSKKRRRDDDHSEVQMSLCGSQKSSPWSRSANSDLGCRTTQYDAEPQNLLCAINNNERLILPSSGRGGASLLNMPRKMIPIPMNKRFRVFSENEGHFHPQHQGSPAGHPSQHLQQSQLYHAHPEYSTPPTSLQNSRTIAAKTMNPTALLSPCHICHRKPTKRSDLDSFADCMGCGQRACFVCIRACQGWLPPSVSEEEEEENLSASFTMKDVDDSSPDQEPDEKQRKGGGGFEGGWSGRGHRAMICSRCCVERGSEGDVVCLGCLAWMEGA
ncbi:hypothetical protein F4818DRAFT_401550 [Hypoxylon cercidicola]|nr:hypothetical protein F4818DRAFT_401550 [Hypoxylon cercidicola]